MPNTRPKQRFWRLCRIYFRHFRISVWLVLIILLSGVLYLNRVGLPEFVKRPLVSKLRDHGVALEFAQLRWHWGDGFVAHGVRFGSMNEPAAPQLMAERVQIQLNLGALVRGRLQVDALGLQNGRLDWIPLTSNAPIRALSVENIQAQLRLLAGDQWRLDDLHARFAGANFIVAASVSNATAIRDWDFLQGTGTAAKSRWPERLQKLADTLETISFPSPPELRLVVEGDARDLQSFGARLNLTAAAATTPWGEAAGIEFVSRLFPAPTNEFSRMDVRLTAASAQTRWANTTNLQLQLRLVSQSLRPDVVEAALSLRAAVAETPWVAAQPVQLKARWVHAVTNPIPQSGQVELATESVVTPWARGAGVRFTAQLAGETNRLSPDPALGWWTNFLPYQLEWSAEARAVKSFRLEAEAVRAAGQWAAARLSVTNLQVRLQNGTVAAEARLDVPSRRLAFTAECSSDLKHIVRTLTGDPEDWFAKISWSEPPRVRAAGTMLLPGWTEAQPDWWGRVAPSLTLAGTVMATNCAYEGIHANWLNTDFTCTNRVWQLRNFTAGRPDGRINLESRVDEVSRDFWFRFDSTLGLSPVRSFLPPEGQEALDWCEFTVPPAVQGELSGNWSDWTRTDFRGRVALTNFTFRQLHGDAAVSDLGYSNRVLRFVSPRLWNGDQFAVADGLGVDFNVMRVYISNAFGRFEPRRITGAIGPETDEVMEPYHFLSPPTARVNGYAPMGNPHDADLVFEGVAGPFECWKFRVPRVAGRVHWLGNTLTLTNMQADFYGGTASGWARFLFPVEPGTRFGFHVTTTDTDLRQLMDDLWSPTNSLDGVVNVDLTITDADTENARSWNGFGEARLRDGLIWSIPVFGVLSKPLDAIMPGVGNSRVSAASATYVITNSVIWSSDLEMHSPAMRLQYRGTVDFDGQVQARVTAEPLRNTPVLGPVVNVALWPVTRLLQYKITGTLADPKPEPVYIPKLLLMPFAPFKTLEDLFTPGTLGTNAPAEIKKAGEVTPAR